MDGGSNSVPRPSGRRPRAATPRLEALVRSYYSDDCGALGVFVGDDVAEFVAEAAKPRIVAATRTVVPVAAGLDICPDDEVAVAEGCGTLSDCREIGRPSGAAT